ncbi:MAG TPA: hypothetical protein VMQ63_04190 [Stellaceae bacterium]|jgi:hypothetical protein|nr:hypothetical protein [Stellaceae bacterium]
MGVIPLTIEGNAPTVVTHSDNFRDNGPAILIQDADVHQFSPAYGGCNVPRVSLLQQGIANTPSKVDPVYKGRLVITAFNHGKRTVTLRRGQPFCSLHVIDVEGARPYDKAGKRIEGPLRLKPLRRLIDRIEAHSLYTAIVVAVVSSVSTLLIPHIFPLLQSLFFLIIGLVWVK